MCALELVVVWLFLAGGQAYPWIDSPLEGAEDVVALDRGVGDHDAFWVTPLTSGRVFFVADGPDGMELSVTNGTVAETMTMDIRVGHESSNPHDLTPFKTGVLFGADNNVEGDELWFSDGTPNGTFIVKDIKPGGDDSAPSQITVFNYGAQALFVAEGNGIGRELWITNGTAGSTFLVAEIQPGTGDGNIRDLFVLDEETVLFVADHPVSGDGELFKYAVGSGVTFVKDIRAASTQEAILVPAEFTRAGSYVYFRADDDVHGIELWRTDGTTAGTQLASDIFVGSDNSEVSNLVSTPDGKLFFLLKSGSKRYLACLGVDLLLTVFPVTVELAPRMVAFKYGVIFSSDDIFAKQPWFSDGTFNGTHRVESTQNRVTGPYGFTPSGDLEAVYFFASWDGNPTMFVTDGVGNLTIPLPTGFTLMSLTADPIGCNMYLSADSSVYGKELFVVQHTGRECGSEWCSNSYCVAGACTLISQTCGECGNCDEDAQVCTDLAFGTGCNSSIDYMCSAGACSERCQPIPDTSNSTSSCAIHGKVVGGKCTLQCSGNVTGSTVLTCGADRSWSGAALQCSTRLCDPLPAPANGNAGTCANGVANNTFCSFECDAGYQLVGGTANLCTGGTYNTTQGCAALPCSPLPPPANGGAGTCASQVASGSSCSFTCSPGYSLQGAAIGCVAASFNSTQTCTPDACAPLPPPVNGEEGTCGSPTSSGSSCSFSCNAGYSLQGGLANLCTASSFSTVQTCTANPCAPLPPPPNGGSGTCASPTASGSTCTFTCNDGYALQGGATNLCTAASFSSVQTCAEMGAWMELSAGAATTVVEGGEAELLPVRLLRTSQPTVVVTLTSVGGLLAFDPPVITLTPAAPEGNVSVRGVADDACAGPVVVDVVADAQDGGGSPIYSSLVLGTLILSDTTVPSLVISGVVDSEGELMTEGGTSEDGDTTTVGVMLSCRPAADVTVAVTSGNAGEVVVSPLSITFTPAQWNTEVTVTLTGVDDTATPQLDGIILVPVTIGDFSSSQGVWSSAQLVRFLVPNVDNDASGDLVQTSLPTASTSEEGGKATFVVTLAADPLGTLDITAVSDSPSEGVVTTGSVLSFTSANYRTPHRVVVSGVDDWYADGDASYAVSLVDTGRTFPSTEVAMLNLDNDTASIKFTDDSEFVVSELGDSYAVSVSLTSQPYSDLRVDFMVTEGEEAAVSPSAVTFSSLGWRTTHYVTVRGLRDFVNHDGDKRFYVISQANPTAVDHAYAGTTARVPGINRDIIFPTVSRVLDAPLSVINGWEMAFEGADILAGAIISIGGKEAVNVTYVGDNYVSFISPRLEEGYYGYRVENVDGGYFEGSPTIYYTSGCPLVGKWGQDECKDCPVGAECPGGNRLWPKPGYWNPSETSGFVRECVPKEACIGGRQVAECAEGYTGDYCSVCEVGYRKQGSFCVECSSEAVSVVLAIADAVVLLALALSIAFAPQSVTHMVIALASALGLVRIVGLMASSPLPGFLMTVYRLLAVTTGEGIREEGCDGEKEVFFLIYFSNLGLAFGALVLSTACLFIKRTIALCRLGEDTGPRRTIVQKKFWNEVFFGVLVLVDFLYGNMLLRNIQALMCVERHNGIRLLVDPTIECFRGVHVPLMCVAIPMLLVHNIGFPAGIAIYTIRMREDGPVDFRILNLVEQHPHKHRFYRSLWFVLLGVNVAILGLRLGSLLQFIIGVSSFSIFLVYVTVCKPFIDLVRNAVMQLVILGAVLALVFNFVSSKGVVLDMPAMIATIAVFGVCAAIYLIRVAYVQRRRWNTSKFIADYSLKGASDASSSSYDGSGGLRECDSSDAFVEMPDLTGLSTTSMKEFRKSRSIPKSLQEHESPVPGQRHLGLSFEELQNLQELHGLQSSIAGNFPGPRGDNLEESGVIVLKPQPEGSSIDSKMEFSSLASIQAHANNAQVKAAEQSWNGDTSQAIGTMPSIAQAKEVNRRKKVRRDSLAELSEEIQRIRTGTRDSLDLSRSSVLPLVLGHDTERPGKEFTSDGQSSDFTSSRELGFHKHEHQPTLPRIMSEDMGDAEMQQGTTSDQEDGSSASVDLD